MTIFKNEIRVTTFVFSKRWIKRKPLFNSNCLLLLLFLLFFAFSNGQNTNKFYPNSFLGQVETRDFLFKNKYTTAKQGFTKMPEGPIFYKPERTIYNSALLSVVISASTDTNICIGTPVTFRVENSNAFSSPSYQWKKNGQNLYYQDATTISHTNNELVNGDTISCTVTDNGQEYASNGIRFTVQGISPVIHIASNNQTCFYTSASQYGFSDFNGYSFFDDLSSGATTLISSGVNDGVSALTDIPFDFNYLGVKYNKFSVNSNGVLSLGNSIAGSSGNNTGPFGNNSIMPWWDDLTTGNNGGVRYKLFVYKDFTKLVIEWRVNASSVNNSFDRVIQLRLIQDYNNIISIYSNETSLSGTGSATVGIAASATDFLSVNLKKAFGATTVSAFTRTDNNKWLDYDFDGSQKIVAFSNSCILDTINSSTKVGFAALVDNAGPSPLYQWKKNGLNVGTNSPVYEDSSLINNDTVWCVLTSAFSCTTNPTVESNKVVINVKPDTFYTFSGNGNWNSSANWAAGIVPPAVIPAGTAIIIAPSPGGQCLLDIPVTFERGAFLTVKDGANFLVQGNLIVH